MIPSRHAMVGRQAYGDAEFIGATSGAAAAAINWPVDTQTGDMAFLVTTGAGPAGWTLVPGGSLGYVAAYTKVLTVADIASPPSPAGDYTACVYRGAVTLTAKAIAGKQGSPGFDNDPNQAAFTKSADCAGRVLIMNWPTAYGSPTFGGSSFNFRVTRVGASTTWQVFDQSSAAFVSGTGITTTWNTSDPAGSFWAMLEFTNG